MVQFLTHWPKGTAHRVRWRRTPLLIAGSAPGVVAQYALESPRLTALDPTGWVRDRPHQTSRRNGQPGNGRERWHLHSRRGLRTPAERLKELPALVLLERMPVPALAVGRDGAILFANPAVAALLGFTTQALMSMTLPNIILDAPAAYPMTALGECQSRIIGFTHADGWTVRTRMSRSVLWPADDSVFLATLDDLTESLWTSEP